MKPLLNIIASQSAIVFPGVKTRIYIPEKYETTINSLLDSPGDFILAYTRDDNNESIHKIASLVTIEDFNKQNSGVWELLIKARERVQLETLNQSKFDEHTNAYSIIEYVDEEFISTEEEMNIKNALQIKLKKNFPNMPPHFYSELMEAFSIAKFLHYLCFSSPKNREEKIELLQYKSLYELYQKLIDSFMK
ncbi:LON peptidase substrate-binding domain-containing protein [Lentisphaera marina]|uniref:LON peptidase substrate-binding domain-containing protein n=1 Tax=Lentisphaera marina TaxID=1111041 RepID=UPI002365BA6F|nr:LON peptidase substrate-binding domain-containing protein [Lentisphaera marina]MDD7984554.1 LON peptidase substrate-binding domain-containing protein [Lentisphaera marina]